MNRAARRALRGKEPPDKSPHRWEDVCHEVIVLVCGMAFVGFSLYAAVSLNELVHKKMGMVVSIVTRADNPLAFWGTILGFGSLGCCFIGSTFARWREREFRVLPGKRR